MYILTSDGRFNSVQAVIKLESWKLQQRLTIYILAESFVQIPLLNKWPETFSSVRQTDIWHDDQLHGHHRDRIVSYPLAALLSRRKKKSPYLTSVHAYSPNLHQRMHANSTNLPIGMRPLQSIIHWFAPTPINQATCPATTKAGQSYFVH